MCCEKNRLFLDSFPLSIPIFSFFQSVLVGSIYVRFSMVFHPLGPWPIHPSNTTAAWVVQEEFEEAIKSMEEVLEVLQIKRFAKRYRHQKVFCSMQMNILAWLFCEIDKTESQNSRALQNEIRFTWQWFQIKTLKRTPWHYNVTLVLINQHELVRWRMGQTCFPQRMVCLLQRTIHPGVCSRALCIEPNRLRKKVIDGCWWRVVLETFLDGAGNPPFIHDFPSETAISWGRDPQLGRHGRRLAAGRRRRPKLVEFLRGWLHGLKEKIGFPWQNHVKSLLSGQKPTVSTSHWWVSRGDLTFLCVLAPTSPFHKSYTRNCAPKDVGLSHVHFAGYPVWWSVIHEHIKVYHHG